MEALKCPVCEGKQTVSAGFYGLGSDMKCRSCDGKGYVLAPEQETTRYVPVPCPYQVWPTYPPTIVWTSEKPEFDLTPRVTWSPNTTGTITVTTNPHESTSQCQMDDRTVFLSQFSIVQ